MAPKDIARSYPKRGITADVGFRSEPKFCGDGSTEFDGSADKVTAAHYNPSGDYLTTTAWVNADTLRAQGLIHNGDTGRNSFLFYMNGSTGDLDFYWNDTTGDARIRHQTQLATGQWYHLAAVMDMSDSADHQVTWYIDGIAATGSRTSATWYGDNSYQFGNQYSSAGWFDGKIANCRIYNAALTQDQIRELYNNPGLDFPSGLTASNLRRHYKLETNFNDSGADSENATASGSPSFTVDRPQLPRGLDLARGAAMARVYTGRAVDFDGSADRITAAYYNPSGDYLTTTAWVNADALRTQGLIHNGNTGRNSFLFVMNDASGNTDLYWNDTTGDARIRHQTQLATGRWYHLAAVMDMSDAADHQVTFYIDGIAATGTRTSAGWVGDNSYQFGNQYSTALFFDGKIADCRIYDVALTQAQVRELYHNPEQVLPTGVSASNLRRYYPLSDYNDTGGTGGRWFQDMGADGEPAEDQGSALMAFAQPVPCPQLGLQQSATRLLFPGGTTTHNAVATTTALGTNASVSCWFQSNNTSSIGLIWSVGLSGTNHWYVYIQSGNIIIGPGNITIGPATEGAWTHLVLTTDSGSPPYKAYVNGAEVSLTGTDTARSLTSGSFEIGNQDVASSPFVFSGIINDIACWNTELSLSDAQSLYNSGVMGMDVSTVQSSNLKGWWKCDDLDTLKDYSGNGANATVTNNFSAASFPENASGSTIVGDFSMKRKGVSVLNPTATPAGAKVQSATISNDGSLSPDPSKGGYSFSAFIRFEQASGSSPWFPMVFSGTNYLTASKRFILNFGDNSVAANAPGITISDGSTPRDYNWPSVLSNPEEWHQLAFTIDYTTSPNTTFKLYLDGALVSTQATNVHSAFDPGDILVGSYTSSNGNFPGAIACFKMYQTKLSDDEIEQIYNSDLRLIKGLANE